MAGAAAEVPDGAERGNPGRVAIEQLPVERLAEELRADAAGVFVGHRVVAGLEAVEWLDGLLRVDLKRP